MTDNTAFTIAMKKSLKKMHDEMESVGYQYDLCESTSHYELSDVIERMEDKLQPWLHKFPLPEEFYEDEEVMMEMEDLIGQYTEANDACERFASQWEAVGAMLEERVRNYNADSEEVKEGE